MVNFAPVWPRFSVDAQARYAAIGVDIEAQVAPNALVGDRQEMMCIAAQRR